MKKKILFLVHDLGSGGAEKVLVNLVNNLDREKFDISVTVLFGGGVNEQYLKDDIRFRAVFRRVIPGNSRWMKLFSPKQLHRMCVKEHYDIEVSYLEGPSARVISGCLDSSTKTVSWIHTNFTSEKDFEKSFRSIEEARHCYQEFDRVIAVSQTVRDTFLSISKSNITVEVLYNTVESERIISLSKESVDDVVFKNHVRLIAIGTLKPVKGFDRLLRIAKKLFENGYKFQLLILGDGPQKEEFNRFISRNGLSEIVQLIGYKSNPFKYLSRSDVFVCSSITEGFSTAATEALIVGTPVCTVDVSGMREMLGDNNEYGIITDNTDDALYGGLKNLLDNPSLIEHYKKKAVERGRIFSTESSVHAFERMIDSLEDNKRYDDFRQGEE